MRTLISTTIAAAVAAIHVTVAADANIIVAAEAVERRETRWPGALLQQNLIMSRAQRPVVCSVDADEQYNTHIIRGRRFATRDRALSSPGSSIIERPIIGHAGYRGGTSRHSHSASRVYNGVHVYAHAHINIIIMFVVSWLHLSCATGSRG